MSKKNSGITLIALIITIIVMLILVAVTINMAVNGGLFGYAGNAAKQTEEAKQKELDWLNVDGMTTDQLIAKYTTDDSEADLKLLERAFLNSDEDAEEVWNIFNEDLDYHEAYFEDYAVIDYHGNYYKVIGNWDDGFTKVQKYNNISNEDLEYLITQLGNLVGQFNTHNILLYRYNGKNYKMTYNSNNYEEVISIEDVSSIAIAYYENDFIIIIPTANQTWSMWASTAGGEDLTVGDTTLKQLINANNDTNWFIINKTNNTSTNDFNTNILAGCIYYVWYDGGSA